MFSVLYKENNVNDNNFNIHNLIKLKYEYYF